MQYITKLATLQSKKTLSPSPYPIDERVWTIKISPEHKIVLRGLCQNLQPYNSCKQKKYIFNNSYMFTLKPFKFTYMKKQPSSAMKTLKFLTCFSLLTTPLTSPLVMSNA
jgi:hypothetical protein